MTVKRRSEGHPCHGLVCPKIEAGVLPEEAREPGFGSEFMVVVGQEMTMPPTQSGSTKSPLPVRLPELGANAIARVLGF